MWYYVVISFLTYSISQWMTTTITQEIIFVKSRRLYKFVKVKSKGIEPRLYKTKGINDKSQSKPLALLCNDYNYSYPTWLLSKTLVICNSSEDGRPMSMNYTWTILYLKANIFWINIYKQKMYNIKLNI